mmetsp:Transcript_17072/g.29836  ORF Transcript_17072/g.29836 Transcript_17072/m.29836 type:complete len:441 (-) Transcript_17072:413-1735(-)
MVGTMDTQSMEMEAAAKWLKANGGSNASAELEKVGYGSDQSKPATKELTIAIARALGHAFQSIHWEETRTISDAAASASDHRKLKTSLEGVVQVVIGALQTFTNMDPQTVVTLAKDISSKTTNGDVRLRALSLLYNAVSDATPEGCQLRYTLLIDLVQTAEKCGLVDLMFAPVFEPIDTFVAKWNLTGIQKKALYDCIATALQSAAESVVPSKTKSSSTATAKKQDYESRAFTFAVKALAVFDYASAAADAQAKERDQAAKVVMQAIGVDSRFRFDELLELDSVKALESAQPKLWQLLNIFVYKNLDDYVAFYQANTSFIESDLKLSNDLCMTKMRLLTFSSMGMEKKELSYKEVAQALQVDEDDVEDWVIKATSAGLVDAKLDQLESRVVINRSTYRVFTQDQWQPLHERLTQWKQNIEELQAILAAKRASISVIPPRE